MYVFDECAIKITNNFYCIQFSLDQMYHFFFGSCDIILIWRFSTWCTQLFVSDQLVKISFPKLAASTIALFGMCRYSDRSYDA